MVNAQNGAQVLKGLLDTLVLQVLDTKDNYGFGILQNISSQLDGDNMVLREATLYPLLHRLETKGLVESYWKPGQRGTDRKYYKITKDGKNYLKYRISDWKNVSNILKKHLIT
ncbi:helix-turn-helix transcriptional regulator [Candidatus Woesearchaeota archaeon]|nr:helix-turn-helix transcriptional regulator [Candidatus Woesearchaeota archaeon]